ncbi:hypothetical protein ACIGQE_20995 [Streptomyces sp. NPDC053429]|uniref:hypothetical protein n=1 Tax=Streptomyces sp. NPDC053429 TaxID=3365702 RepID=UPI0037CDBE92
MHLINPPELEAASHMPARRSAGDRRVAVAGQAAAFADAATRMLLVSDGLTTPLLQAVVGQVLRPRVTALLTVSAQSLSSSARSALALTPGQQCLVRHSQLVAPGGTPVSENTAIAPEGRDTAVASALRDRHRPLGFALQDAGVHPIRSVLSAGLATWPDGGPCAYKTYLLLTDGVPAVHIRELFNPRMVCARLLDPDEYGASPGFSPRERN